MNYSLIRLIPVPLNLIVFLKILISTQLDVSEPSVLSHLYSSKLIPLALSELIYICFIRFSKIGRCGLGIKISVQFLF